MLRWREAIGTYTGQDAEEGTYCLFFSLGGYQLRMQHRSGSIKEILSFFPFGTSKMIRLMLSSSIPLMKHVTVCASIITDLAANPLKSFQ